MARAELAQEIAHQQRDVFTALAQGRQVDGEDVQPVQQVLAEAPCFHLAAQVHIGGGDDPHIHRDRRGAAHPLDLALLQHPQDLALGAEAQGGDLVEEQGAAFCPFESSGAGTVGSGEGAALHTEELRLQQGFRQRRTVERHQRRMVTRAGLVQGAREQLLAHPRFTREQYGGLGRRNAVELLAGGDEGGGNTHHGLALGRLIQLGHFRFVGRAVGAAAEKITDIQMGQIGINVLPLLRRLADDAAGRMPHATTLLFAEHHQASQQGRGIATGVAHLHPAGRLAAQPVAGDVLVGFQGVVPEELRIEVADAGVDVKAHHLDVHHALQHVQARAGAVEAGVVALGPLRADLGCIPRPCLPADSRKKATCLVQTQGFHQFAADGAEGGPLKQHHALATKPDIAVLGGEGDGLGQLLGCRQPGAAELVGSIDDQAFLPAEQLLEEFIPHGAAGIARGFTSHGHGQETGGREKSHSVCPGEMAGQLAGRHLRTPLPDNRTDFCAALRGSFSTGGDFSAEISAPTPRKALTEARAFRTK
ncbi:hypothetical protein D9M71_208640 [compost metagenome]